MSKLPFLWVCEKLIDVSATHELTKHIYRTSFDSKQFPMEIKRSCNQVHFQFSRNK